MIWPHAIYKITEAAIAWYRPQWIEWSHHYVFSTNKSCDAKMIIPSTCKDKFTDKESVYMWIFVLIDVNYIFVLNVRVLGQ